MRFSLFFPATAPKNWQRVLRGGNFTSRHISNFVPTRCILYSTRLQRLLFASGSIVCVLISLCGLTCRIFRLRRSIFLLATTFIFQIFLLRALTRLARTFFSANIYDS